MRFIQFHCFSSVLLCLPCCLSVEPITFFTTVGGILAGAGYAVYNHVNCKYNECCDDNWVKFNYTGFKSSLENNLYGQHLALNIIPKALKGFLENNDPKKPLVLSFHGSTGNGKNFVTHMIENNLYKNGTRSLFIHQYIANKDFPHAKEVPKYQDKLRRDIIEYTKLCGRSLFIFDEVHQMPTGVLDAIKPFLDYHEMVDGVDYRKNIFIFLSNAGGRSITEVTLESWLHGKDRKDITMKDIEPLIAKGSFNERGGFQHSQIIKNELIDFYIPFLPLEKAHVRKCIIAELKAQGKTITNSVVDTILENLVYFPEDTGLFSVAGCKKIEHKVMVYA